MNLPKLLILLFLFTTSGHAFSADANQGERLEIAIMTMGPYQSELYSAFGHSAIRVRDSVTNTDYVFNYGVFNFDQENFYWNFAKGKMLYQLGLSDYERFRNHYEQENRYIIEQYLNLTPDEKVALFNFLKTNYQPGNREYYYNYVYNNCSSKIRDLLIAQLPGEITFNQDYVEENLTIRDLMDRYLAYQPWGDWIIDIGLGHQIDKVASAQEYMFLPDYVEKGLSSATIQRDSVVAPLISKTVHVYTPTPETFENDFFTPFNTFVLIFFIIGFITNRDFKRGKRTHWVDMVLFTFVGIIGWWCAFLWLGTEHLSKDNMNLLWAIPFHLPLIYFVNVPKFQKVISKYFLFTSIFYVVLLFVWGILPQPLHEAMIPLVLVMILRGFFINYDINRIKKRSTP